MFSAYILIIYSYSVIGEEFYPKLIFGLTVALTCAYGIFFYVVNKVEITKWFKDGITGIISLIKGLLSLVLIGVVFYLGYKVILFGFDAIRPKSWTLMVCEGEIMTDGGCYDISYELKDYSSQKSCMEKGLTLPKISGFECGLDCEMSDYGMRVCETICNKGGCGD